MFPLLGGLITGGASLLGSMFSSDTAKQNTEEQIAGQQAMQKESETFNAGQAEINRDYQTQMSNTAYQRASQDMQKAGLNPMMMFGSGSAASSPSGSSASVGTPSMPNVNKPSPFAGLGDAVGKAVSSAVSLETFDKMKQEIANMQVQQAKTAAETATEKERPEYVRSQRFNVDTATAREANRMPVSRLEGLTASDVEAMPDWLRRSAVQTGFVADKASKVTDVAGGLLSSALRAKGLGARRSTEEITNNRGDSTFKERFQY